MPGSLERTDDGSIALYIDNDLQFDSKDEHIYHEALVLPALALANNRIPSPLKVLIIGGGDGLVARELFKSTQVSKVDLVDYDPEILNYAHTEFAQINQFSLSDPRLSIHIRDAWNFVDEAITSSIQYDLIISDLTVPDDTNSARFHSIDWYNKLSSLLSTNGILAVNGVSAFASPEAFWSVFNSMSKAGLHTRPYHIQIPSFIAKGYGKDWAFYLASNKNISAEEFDPDLSLVQPRKFIKDIAHIRSLFLLPTELFAFQSKSAPALAGSDILISYFHNASTFTISGDNYDSLTFNFDIKSIPEPDNGKNVLPPNLVAALAQINFADTTDSEKLLEDILELMPSLQKQCPPELINEFVENPINFLQGVDLLSLINKLLQRAKELPAQLVSELELLRDKLQDWAGDQLSLLALGQRVLTVLTLVIIIGNVLYPDSVYGKGEHAGHHATSAAPGERDGARRSGDRRTGEVRTEGRHGRYVNGTWVDDPYWNGPEYINKKPRVIKEEIIERPAPRVPVKQNTTGFLPNSNIAPSAYLAIAQRNLEAQKNRLLQNQKDLIAQKAILEEEIKQYQSSPNEIVNFGIHKLEKAEAIKRTQLVIQKTDNLISLLDKQMSLLPSTADLAKLALANMQSLNDFIIKANKNEPT